MENGFCPGWVLSEMGYVRDGLYPEGVLSAHRTGLILKCSQLILNVRKMTLCLENGQKGRNMFGIDRTRPGHVGHYLYKSGTLGTLPIHVETVVQYSELMAECL